MKAVAINPVERRIVVEDVDPTPAALRRLCGPPRRVLATLPNGDVILAAEGEEADAGFSVGGSKAIRSPAIVLGRHDSFGGRTAPRSSVELLAGLVRWVNPAPAPEPEHSDDAVTVIVVDPEIGLIDHADIDRNAAGCQSAPKFDPSSASNFDPFVRRALLVALVSSELAGIAEAGRARVA